MTNEERKVIELALEALERSVATCFDQRSHDEVMGRPEHFVNQTITTIKEALAQPDQDEVDIRSRLYQRIHELETQLAQPEQEPVAVVDVHEFYDNCANFSLLQKLPKGKHTLYTTPPQRKPLTHEQRFDLLTKFEHYKNKWGALAILIDMVEAAHGIKE